MTDCYSQKERIKMMQGRTYDKKSRAWLAPISKDNVNLLESIVEKKFIPKECYEFISDTEKKEQTVNEMRLADKVEPIAPMPVKGTPYMHQVRGYNMALKVFGY